MDKLKVGIIGVGHLGKLHTKMFSGIKNCELIGIYDIDLSNAHSVGDELKVKVFESEESLLNVVNAASVAVTTSAHYEVAKRCLERGIHIFIEKPITSTITEAETLVKLASDKKLTLQVGHIERFNPALVSLEKYIINPLFIQSDRLSQFNPRGTDVAVVLDLMIHDIDVILSLIKSEVKRIDANGVPVVSDNVDIANARIQFENGAVANVTASRISQKKMRKMRIWQRDNYIALDFVTGASEMYRLLPLGENISAGVPFGEIGVGGNKKKLFYEQPETKEINALSYELELFINAVINKTRPVVSGEDGLRALAVADDIIKKIEESKLRMG
ncbi:MAG: oxidoreductase [Ignavibacteria bacterium GWA2_35_9]|nr:MAG: oxidoreductase [Ignavibacteria bacterium GWA2_35_9]OGU53544.1 MAG: oxidoreductase [Ignavibacteria bacterium GWC2_36_12]OGV17071.1 MAG: oxidoreductase [Ignavibacteria bacterium RIFOXYA2_FULL_37_17]